jgi:hypothetical protein
MATGHTWVLHLVALCTASFHQGIREGFHSGLHGEGYSNAILATLGMQESF